MMFLRWLCHVGVLIFCYGQSVAAAPGAAREFDLVVYGGTASGTMAAVAAAREGLRVALLEPRRNVGGMATGGLSASDVGKREVIGGLALEFYHRVARHYEMRRFQTQVVWNYEPHVGERLFRGMLASSGVEVLFGHRLREKDGVSKQGSRLVEIVTENGAAFRAKVFADCTYEGDLLAQAGVSYTVGRESTQEYGEPLAGVGGSTEHRVPFDVPALDAQGRLLPLMYPSRPGLPGSGDRKVQAYNFRVIMTDDPANRVPLARPEGYSVGQYELFVRFLHAMKENTGRDPGFNDIVTINYLPNRKADINNRGVLSTDYVGKSFEYPDASYAKREEIWKEHEEYTKGLLYFLANDPRLPEATRKNVAQWGLAKDEFIDNGNWPHQLYVREGRRMFGEYVMRQQDIQSETTKPDPIGLGSYNSDSHFLDRYVTDRGMMEVEGGIYVPTNPYQIPYRSLLPKKREASNLLVTICLSASHVAYCSLRMEPQYMMTGHAAGIAAALAVRKGLAVQDIDIRTLRERLVDQGAILEYVPSEQNQILGGMNRSLPYKRSR